MPTIAPNHSHEEALNTLRAITGNSWDNIANAASRATERRSKIEQLINAKSLIPTDTSLVVFGSLARDEFTSGSDCDWTLLVDGLADSTHHQAASEISRTLDAEKIAKPPGPTGVFGSLAYSHELVHQIGGDEDTNKNTTRRILLLLESTAIPGMNSALVRKRVARQIIKRYLEQEPDLLSGSTRRIPRLLLNDVVRYWRTMAVDYARKVRDRSAEGWALRNIKLRLSRKLTFVSGMLACFDCVHAPATGKSETDLFESAETRVLSVQEHILAYVEATPIDVLARAVCAYSADDDTRKRLGAQLFDSYDKFLATLDDSTSRETLAKLRPDDAESNQLFQTARKHGQAFQSGLIELFFKTNAELTKTTQEYGVF